MSGFKQHFAYSSADEVDSRKRFLQLFRASPIPDSEVLENLGLFVRRQSLSRMFFMAELYRKILPVHGIIVEFGVRWGQNLALFHSFRGMWEPFNFNRKIVGFDTFEGAPPSAVSAVDGPSGSIQPGTFALPEGYAEYLDSVLSYHEKESPIQHLKKYEIVKGDVSRTVKEYLAANPETIIALAYFDLVLYQPTKDCLEAISGHLTKGSILGFDELNTHATPGETLAVKEVFGLDKYRLRRLHDFQASAAYMVIE